MGRNIPLLLVRAATIVCACLLLFAVFSAHAHAQDDYGLAPLPATQGAPAPIAPAPNPMPSGGDGFSQVPQSGGAPQSAPVSAMSAPPPMVGSPSGSDGFAPAPASTAMAAPNPAPQLAGPVSNGPYGFNSGDGLGKSPAPQLTGSVSPGYGFKPGDGNTLAGPSAYGFKSGDGTGFAGPVMPRMPTAASALSGPPLRMAQNDNNAYGYKSGDGEGPGGAPMAGAPAYAAYQPADNAPRFNSDYVLGPGDKLRLTVFDETDLSGEYAIDGSGYVRLPLIGQVRAGGYTAAQLEGAIGSALANGYLRSPRVSVEVSTYRPFYIIGAVNRPGEYPYVDHMNALNAVALAGGFLPSAKESTLYVRPQGSTQEYRMPADASTPIHPGDVVRVDTTVFWDTMSLFSPLTGVAGVAAAGIR